MLKFPKLLRKQYLNLSPIWKAYLNGGNVPQQCFIMNAKLFSAYSLAEALNAGNVQAVEKILSELDRYREKIEENKKQEKNQSLQKVYKFISIYKNRQWKDANYAKDIYEIYKNICKDTEQNVKDSKQEYMQLYLKLLSRLSSQESIDDIDLLILQTLQIGTPQLILLQRVKLDWSIQNKVTGSVFKKLILKQMCRRNFSTISVLKKYLNKLKESIEHESALVNKHQAVLNSVLKCLQNMISSRNSMQDIDKQSIYLLLSPLDLLLKKQFGFSNYLEVLSVQYTLLLDWLAVKSLYRSTRGSFVSNLDEFCCKFKFMNLPRIAQIRMSKSGQTEEQIIKIYEQQQLCKLEIVTFIYNTIMQCASASIQTKKMDGNKKYIQQNLQKVAEVRQLKIEQEKIVSRMFGKSSNKVKMSQQPLNTKFHQLIGHLESIQKIVHVINAGVTSKRPIRIQSSTIRELGLAYIEQITNYDVILLSKSQIITVNNVINEVQDMIKNSRVRQYHKKVSKYLEKKEIGKVISEQNQFESTGRAKILWMRMRKQGNKETNKQLTQLRNSIFLMCGQEPQPAKQDKRTVDNKKQTDLGSKNRYVHQMKQLFE